MYKLLLTLIFMLLLNYCFFLISFCFIKDFCCGSSVILTMVYMWVVISGKLWNWHAVVAA